MKHALCHPCAACGTYRQIDRLIWLSPEHAVCKVSGQCGDRRYRRVWLRA